MIEIQWKQVILIKIVIYQSEKDGKGEELKASNPLNYIISGYNILACMGKIGKKKCESYIELLR